MFRRLQEFNAAVEDFLKALDMMSEHEEDMVRQTQRQLLLAYNDFAVHCYTQGAYQEGVLLLNKVLKDEQQEKSFYINRGGEAPEAPRGWGEEERRGREGRRREKGKRKHFRASVSPRTPLGKRLSPGCSEIRRRGGVPAASSGPALWGREG